MSLRTTPLVLLITLSVSVMAQDALTTEGRPLNLSLPRDAYGSSPIRPSLATPEQPHGNSGNLPDLGGGQRSGIPYGSGYEARQHGSSNSGSGNPTGMRSGQGSGRGMGRGR